ncbi:MAG TPA: tetratricopeptide repeat protein [Planctomycetaceae bacterium]|nr:tetratricopeptide repeat protein [Planctomycetaceae bacterium]
MRRVAIALGTLLLAAGCGSENKAPETGTAGIPLSISGNQNQAIAANGGQKTAIPQYSEAVLQLLKKANAGVVAGNYGVGVEALSQAIGISPDDASLFRMRADIYVLQGENANARVDFGTAIRLAPDNADYYNYRGYFLMSQRLQKEALADFDKAIQLNSAHSAAHNNRGLLALTTQDYKSAEVDFSKALDSDRKFADAWNNRGFARMKLEQYEPALSDLQQAIRIQENYVTAWNNCGLLYMQQEKYDDALKSFARAVELEPMDMRWLSHHRAALLKLKRFAEAQQDQTKLAWLDQLNQLTQQATRDARNPAAWIVRGSHLMRGSQYGAAVQDFTRALIVNPGNTDALTGRAAAWLATGELEKAMLDCDESIVSQSTQQAYSLRGDVWMRLENLDNAISDFEAAGRFDDMVAVAYEKRADQRRGAGKTDDAQSDLDRAREIREAMVDKKVDSEPPQSAEGFNPALDSGTSKN